MPCHRLPARLQGCMKSGEVLTDKRWKWFEPEHWRFGDPAGKDKSQYDEVTAFDILKREGFTAMPALTNNIESRLRAVEAYLLQQRDGGPAILFDRGRCPKLIQAMNGMYRYSKTSLDISKPKPDKNEWSHVSDALQYAALATGGATYASIARKLYPRQRSGPRVSSAAWT